MSFRLAYYTDAAGKYSPGAARDGNEDDFFIKEDLTDDNAAGKAAQDEAIRLGRRGMLMAVADGMGGMNAGEVASKIAIDTVKEEFSANAVGEQAFDTSQSREKYLESVIRKADRNIKSEASRNRGCEGMGSTIIMAWLYGNELSVSWCGDSRAYIFNDKSGIRLVSKDHSYVQELVDRRVLTYEQTFDHPQNNIITRSLGDPSGEAKPESKTVNVGRGDIILLCSDGLSGVLRDRKTFDETTGQPFPEENLEDIIRAHAGSMRECRKALWEAAERGGWYDNVTAILCQITDGPESEWPPAPADPGNGRGRHGLGKEKPIIMLSVVALAVVAASLLFLRGGDGNGDDGGKQSRVDSALVATADSVSEEDSIGRTAGGETDSSANGRKRESQDSTSDTKPTISTRVRQQDKEKKDSSTVIKKQGTTVKQEPDNSLTRIKRRDKSTPDSLRKNGNPGDTAATPNQ